MERERKKIRKTRRSKTYLGTTTSIPAQVRANTWELANVERQVRKLKSEQELHHHDVFFAQAVDNSWDLQHLTGITQGTEEEQYIGEQIRTTSLKFRGRFLTSSSLENTTLVRLIIFWDAQANGAAPTIDGSNDALLDTTTITDNVLAPYQKETFARFRVIYDKVFVSHPNSASDSTFTTAVPKIVFFKKKIKLGRKVFWNETSIPITNSLYAAIVTNQASGTAPTVNIGYRVYFKDPQ